MSAHDLRGVVVGDAVAVFSYGISHTRIAKRVASKVSATQVTLDDGSRWLRRGKKFGSTDSFHRDRAEPWDESKHGPLLNEYERLMLASHVSRLDFTRLGGDQLLRIKSIAEEPKA